MDIPGLRSYDDVWCSIVIVLGYLAIPAALALVHLLLSATPGRSEVE